MDIVLHNSVASNRPVLRPCRASVLLYEVMGAPHLRTVAAVHRKRPDMAAQLWVPSLGALQLGSMVCSNWKSDDVDGG